jgi:hypothetical protein
MQRLIKIYVSNLILRVKYSIRALIVYSTSSKRKLLIYMCILAGLKEKSSKNSNRYSVSKLG